MNKLTNCVQCRWIGQSTIYNNDNTDDGITLATRVFGHTFGIQTRSKKQNQNTTHTASKLVHPAAKATSKKTTRCEDQVHKPASKCSHRNVKSSSSY